MACMFVEIIIVISKYKMQKKKEKRSLYRVFYFNLIFYSIEFVIQFFIINSNQSEFHISEWKSSSKEIYRNFFLSFGPKQINNHTPDRFEPRIFFTFIEF